MERNLTINGRTMAYTLKSGLRYKKLKLSVYPDGGVVVSKPWWLSIFLAEKFICRKAEWIFLKKELFKENKALSQFLNENSYTKNKKAAKSYLLERIRHFNAFYNFSYRRVAVRNQRTRWGSCSEKGNLNFNYRIMYLPREIADYIIVHELCHLKENNHSARFWQLVAEAIPDYHKRRKSLRRIM